MNPVLTDLLTLLDLERIEENIFRGESRDIGSAQVFGGQVLGQALAAAYRTVEGRRAHSLHAYFLRRGDVTAPIIYDVDRSRDGGSFSVRRVVAIQHGRPIFNFAASFQKSEDGLEHHAAMPEVDGPDGLKDLTEIAPHIFDKMPQKLRRYLTEERPFDFRPVEANDYITTEPREAKKHVWIRTVNALPETQSIHQILLAYVSDYELLGTSTLPHGLQFGQGRIMMASLDHALWFHRNVRLDDWLLYAMDSPNSSGARGFSRGQFFTRDGLLVASTSQEGLVRIRDNAPVDVVRSDPRSQT